METKNWKWFRYDEIFEIKKGKRLTKADMEEGSIRYIGAIDSNNGLSAWVGNNAYIHSSNTITVSYNGSIGYAYYQDKEFWATDDVNVLYPKFKLNKNIALFLCSIIQKEQYRFCYGRKWDKELMEESKIKLPTIQNENNEFVPDWQWIENYVKETIIPKLPSKSKSVWQQQFNSKPLLSKKLELKVAEWKWFRVGEIFQCKTTSHCIDYEMDKGSTPFVSRSAINNGVSNYVDKKDKVVYPKNCITIGAEGILAFYQPESFLTGVKIYTIRSPYLNPYVAMFICTILNREVYRYNYGNARILEKIKKEKIKLPAIKTAAGEYEPDWQWMEDYIKGLPYSGCLE